MTRTPAPTRTAPKIPSHIQKGRKQISKMTPITIKENAMIRLIRQLPQYKDHHLPRVALTLFTVSYGKSPRNVTTFRIS
jgi:hypothetical protein